MNLVRVLNQSFQISIDQLEQGIAERAEVVYPDTHNINQWINIDSDVPGWARRAAAKWLIELWIEERNECEAEDLLKIDKKYTAYLKDFSMAEIITMQQTVATEKNNCSV